MQLRAVAFVLTEAILRKTRAKVAHNRVAGDLRNHARGRYAEAVAIAIDNGCLRQGEGEDREAIDKGVLWLHRERLERGAHRFVSGAENIDRVDLNRIDNPNGPRNPVVCRQIVVNLLPLLRQKLFRIV